MGVLDAVRTCRGTAEWTCVVAEHCCVCDCVFEWVNENQI